MKSLTNVHTQFIEHVEKHRKIPTERKERLFSAEVFTGSEAISNG